MSSVVVREMRPEDFPGIIRLCQAVYPGAPSWATEHLNSHLSVFPEGQLVAIEGDEVVGYASCLIVDWDDYDFKDSWREMTDHGLFTNHDPVKGRTLYGAEVMVHPDSQGQGVGSSLYRARESLLERLNLLRIRAGARLIGYGKYADKMSATDYVLKVTQGKITDATLSFQLNRGFQVLAVTSGYLKHDPQSLGFAAVIELLNPTVAKPEHFARQKRSPFYFEKA